jgi:hypothetical protein
MGHWLLWLELAIHLQLAEEKSWMPRGAPWRLRRHDAEKLPRVTSKAIWYKRWRYWDGGGFWLVKMVGGAVLTHPTVSMSSKRNLGVDDGLAGATGPDS